MKVFIKEHVPLVGFVLLGVGMNLVMFCLYQLEMEAFLYGSGLYLLVLAGYLSVHFFRERQKHRRRRQMMAAGIGELTGGSAEWEAVQETGRKDAEWESMEWESTEWERADSWEVQDLQDMIRCLRRRCSELTNELQNGRQESLDYYTTWVHQIKTPISVMQMILQSEDTAEHRELKAELFRIEQYVEMVLTYIRLGSDDHDFVFRECDLDALIRESIHKYAPQFIRRRIRLIYEPVQMTVLTDEKWLAFILEQLLSNAVKYTYQGSVTISVSSDQKLSVADTGIGIAKEDLPRIFEKGFTGYNGRADKKSTGLGLYLCRRTADRLGISIHADSTPGKGSVFTLDLAVRNLEVE